MSNRCPPPCCPYVGAGDAKFPIGFFAAFHRTFLYARDPLFPSRSYISCNTARAERSLALAAPRRLPSWSSMSWDPVYKLVQQIPRGRVATYGTLARVLHLRGGARTAGRALAATPSGRGIPWHRVVGERGKLLIPEPHASLQRKLLESEGVKIVEMRVDYASHGWAPKRIKSPLNAKKSLRKKKPSRRKHS